MVAWQEELEVFSDSVFSLKEWGIQPQMDTDKRRRDWERRIRRKVRTRRGFRGGLPKQDFGLKGAVSGRRIGVG